MKEKGKPNYNSFRNIKTSKIFGARPKAFRAGTIYLYDENDTQVSEEVYNDYWHRRVIIEDWKSASTTLGRDFNKMYFVIAPYIQDWELEKIILPEPRELEIRDSKSVFA